MQIAGIVQQTKMKTTRNQSMMAYVTLEDDTGAMELLVFAKSIEQYGAYLAENSAVVVTGRISVRDEKAPQLIVNQAMPIADFTQSAQAQPAAPARVGRIYLRLPSETGSAYRRVRPVLNMFPGQTPVVLYFADTRIRRQTFCLPEADLLEELREILGAENVVVQDARQPG